MNNNEFLEDFKPTFGLAGLGIGSSILGGTLQPHLPAGVTNPLTQTGSTISGFIPLTASLGGFSIVTKQFKKLEGGF